MNINHVVSGASNALQINWNEWNNAQVLIELKTSDLLKF